MTTVATPPQVQTDPQYEITDADKARQQAIALAWKAYDGLLDPPLIKMPGQADDNVLSNRCKAVVRRGMTFLFGKELEISVEEGAPQEAQDLLKKVWGRKEKRIPLLLRLAMNGALSGCAFLRIVPGIQKGSFRLVELDPSTIFLKTAPQDCQTVVLFCIEYCTDEKINSKSQRVYYREEISRIDPFYQSDNQEDTLASAIDEDVTWQISHWTKIGEKGNWQAAGNPYIWPYPFAPVFYCQNMSRPNDPWGEADITFDLIGLNNALNLNLSGINRDGKLFSHPILYSNGVGEADIDATPGRIVHLPLPDSKITAVALSSDTANQLAFAADLRSDMDELTGVPGVATGRMKDLPRGNVSGVVIELMHSPLLSKTDEKRCTYGEMILDVSKALLVLAGMSGDIEITLAWQSPLPSNTLENVQAAVMKQQLHISDTTLMRELGYDPDEEMELSQTEDAQKLAAYARGQGLPVSSANQQQQSNMPAESPFIGGQS